MSLGMAQILKKKKKSLSRLVSGYMFLREAFFILQIQLLLMQFLAYTIIGTISDEYNWFSNENAVYSLLGIVEFNLYSSDLADAGPDF